MSAVDFDVRVNDDVRFPWDDGAEVHVGRVISTKENVAWVSTDMGLFKVPFSDVTLVGNSAMRFRTKPVEVEAVLYRGATTQMKALQDWIDTGRYVDPGMTTRDLIPAYLRAPNDNLVLGFNEFLVKHQDGTFEVLTMDEFRKTYEHQTR